MLSILIPIYNDDVRHLVTEIHAQAKKANISFEIIAVDDCSTQTQISSENKKIISQLSNCRYRENKNNLGRTATRNILAENARYKYLLFLDADVMPENSNFIEKLIASVKKNNYAVIYGGIAKNTKIPTKDKRLRWKFANQRESKTLALRKKEPYLSLISQGICIQKDVFLAANTFLENRYGLDILFSYRLKKMKVAVLHIENPIINHGLEDNKSFINKSKRAIDSLLYFEEKDWLPKDYSSLQKAYLHLEKKHATTLFRFIIGKFNSLIKKNLCSKKPSLFLFDLYRLNYFICQKKNSNNA